MSKFLFFIFYIELLIGWSLAQPPEPFPIPGIEEKQDGARLILTTSIDGAVMSLTDNRRDGVLHLRTSSPIPVDTQITILRAMLPRIPEVSEKTSGLRTFFVGRLIQYPEFAKRLAKAAAESNSWDPSQSSTYPEMVAEIARKHGIFQEWHALFDEFGLEIRLSHMEKVLVSTPSELIPFGPWLLEQSIAPDQQLPFDALTFFSVRTKH